MNDTLRNFTDRKLKEIFSKIKRTCKACHGKGYIINEETSSFKDCECIAKFNVIKKYLEANIPEEYINIKLDDLYQTYDTDTMKLFINVMKNIETITSQYGLYVHPCEEEGTFGVTTCGTFFVRALVDKGRTGFFINMEAIIDTFFSDDSKKDEQIEIANHIRNVDVLQIDGLGNEYYKFRDDNSFVCNKFISFLNTRKSLGKITIMSSDMSMSDMNSKYSKTFINNLWRLFAPVMIRCQKQRDRKDGIRALIEKFPDLRERFSVYDGRKYRDK